MKHWGPKHLLSLIMAIVMVIGCVAVPVSATQETAATSGGGQVAAINDPAQGLIHVSEETKLANSDKVTILVGIAEDTVYMQTGDLTLAATGYSNQMATYARAESKIETALAESIEVENRYSLLFNGFSFTGEKWMIDAINQIDGLAAFEDVMFELVEPTATDETVTLVPSTSNSTSLVTANFVWDLGYTGEGMVIAIIDSGIRQTHEAFSVAPSNAKIDKDYLTEVYEQYGDKMHACSTYSIEDCYYNAKLPFCWDYVNSDPIPEHTATDHGTHVAGIAAGNNGDTFKGVAPDAQIIPMCVFDESGGASFTTLMAAMEDCVYLGVDAINMSLGVAAFFSAYEAIDAYMEELYNTLEASGIAVCVAAGNDTTTSRWNNYSLRNDKARAYGMWSMYALDNGVVGAPGTFAGSFCVASVFNSTDPFCLAADPDNVQPEEIWWEANLPSYFSSWGTTAALEIKPEISAPGGGIQSAIGFGENDSYASWDGTSMATPHVAGGILLVKQALKEKYPDATASEINKLAYNYLLSTAHGIDYAFVRTQGAGMMDLLSAVTSNTYCTVDGGRPKLELDDSETGVFEFSFEVHNDGDTDKTYTTSTFIMTQRAEDLAFSGYRENYGYNQSEYREYNQEHHFFLSNDTYTYTKVSQGMVNDVTSQCSLTGDTAITVPAGQTVTVNMTLTCNSDLMSYISENCPAGNYLEGWIRLKDASREGGPTLSLPFLGFVGDWDYVPMFDLGYWWQLPYGEANLSMSAETQGTFVGYGSSEQGLGLNYYGSMKGKTYLEDRNAISPNGDGILDAVDSLQFALMRNPKTFKIYIEDENGNILSTLFDEDYWFRKEYFVEGLNGGTTFSAAELEYDWSQLEENQTVNLVVEAWLEHEEYQPEDNYNGRMVFPVTIDTTAPEIIPEFYSASDSVCLGLNVVDKNYVSYYAVYADAACTELLYENTFFANNRNNWECSFNTDWTDNSYRTEYYVFAADYAGNETLVKCSYEGNMMGEVTVLDASTCPASVKYQSKTVIGRQMVNWNSGNYEYGFVKMDTSSGSMKEMLTENDYDALYDAGWGWDFTAAAVRYDGTLFINSFRHLAILDPETYEITYVATFNEDTSSSTPSVRNIMSHPDTGELYAFAYLFGANEGEYYCKLDTKTGELTRIWKIRDDLGYNPAIFNWAYAYISADVIAIFASNGYVWLVNESDGTLIEEIDMGVTAPSGELQFGIWGTGGNMLYDEDINTLYIYSNWSWIRHCHYNSGGYVTLDLDTNETTLHTTGAGMGYTVYGLYFEEDLVAKSWAHVITLIDAIAEAETLEEMKAAIDAARAAYDALPEEDQKYINNYQDLLDAEAEYLILVARNHAEGAAAAAEEAAAIAEEAAAIAEEAAALAGSCEEAAAAAEDAAEAAAAAVTAAEEAAAAAEKAAAAAEAGDIEGAAAAEQEALDALEAAKAALADAKAALEAARAADAAAALEAAKDAAAKALEELADDTEGYSDHQLEDHEAALAEAEEAIENAETAEEIDTIIAELKQTLKAIAESCPAKEFTDVNLDAWYHEYTDYVLIHGLMKGMGGTEFAPNDNLTRAMMVTTLYRLAGAPEVETTSSFTDVAEDQWYADAVAWAAENGIVLGISETVFAPNQNITREQAATILYRYVTKHLEVEPVDGAALSYTDAAQIADYAKDAVAWATAEGIFEGFPGGSFQPRGTLTRAQMAKLLTVLDETL